MLKKFEKYDVISFDLYDTLLKRNVAKATDLFKIVEFEYNKKFNKSMSFVDLRIKSEASVRSKKSSEITLDEIYNEMLNFFNNDVMEKLKKLEIEIEKKIIQRNKNDYINRVYNYAKENKKIIICTDMYLPEYVIKEILTKLNISYDKLYVSSSIGCRKKDGTLFDYVLSDLNIDSSQLIHVGDNKNSDYLIPKKKNISSVLVKTNVKNAKYWNSNLSNKNSINYNIFESFINNNIDLNANYFEKFGYEIFGPLLFNFSLWLKNSLKEDDIKNVFFLARDGEIMKEAFDIINDEDIKTTYMMASRRSLIVPTLYSCKSIDEIFDRMHVPSKIDLISLKKRIGLDDFDITEKAKKFNLNIEKKYDSKELLSKYRNFFDEIFCDIIDNSKKEYTAMKKYFSKINFNGKVGIIDIGWYGNMQLALSNSTNANITGYYVGLRPGKKTNIVTKGFLFDSDKNIDLFEKEVKFTAIFEFIFSTFHGSVKRFVVNNEEDCELYNSENTEEYERISLSDLQKGALNFIKDIYASNVYDYINISEYDCCINLFKILLKPDYLDAKKMGMIKFKDDEVNYIANPEKTYKYILNYKKLVKDFNKSNWKIGFLKRLFILNLPYDKLYFKLLKIKEK